MKSYYMLLFLVLISCNRKYTSNGYNLIKLYEYNGKPWDNDATSNRLYNGELTNKMLYSKIEELNYNFKKSFATNQKIDSVLFRKKYEKVVEDPQCPAGNNKILLLYEDSNLNYVVEFNQYCKRCFLINIRNNKRYFINIGYEDFIKLVDIE